MSMASLMFLMVTQPLQRPVIPPDFILSLALISSAAVRGTYLLRGSGQGQVRMIAGVSRLAIRTCLCYFSSPSPFGLSLRNPEGPATYYDDNVEFGAEA